MFISFGKFLGKSKIRVGAGMRITKKNFLWMSLILLMYYCFLLMWYIMVLCGWMVYAVCYGMFAAVRGIVRLIKKLCTQNRA